MIHTSFEKFNWVFNLAMCAVSWDYYTADRRRCLTFTVLAAFCSFCGHNFFMFLLELAWESDVGAGRRLL